MKLGKMLDIDVLNRLLQKANYICSVEIKLSNGDHELGTGFLVGESQVITSYHIMELVINWEERAARGEKYAMPNQVEFRFGYKITNGDLIADKGRTFKLQDANEVGQKWLVDSSPRAPFEKDSFFSNEDPSENELDFAVVKIDIAPKDSWGWLSLPAYQKDINYKEIDFLAVIQHPYGYPMQFSFATAVEVNASGTRLLYQLETGEGSSGAPCFDQYGRLVAIHQSSDKKSGTGYRQGIPINKIVQVMESKGKVYKHPYIDRMPLGRSKNPVYPFLPHHSFRYLECLDSFRYTEDTYFIAGDSRIRELNANCELFIALLTGDGIVISENQLFDCPAWVKTFADLLDSIKSERIAVPVKVSVMEPDKGLFGSLIRNLRNINPDNLESRYKLSLFPTIDQDPDARKDLADYLSQMDMGIKPQSKLINKIEKIEKALEFVDKIKKEFLYLYDSQSIEKSISLPHLFKLELETILELSNDQDGLKKVFVEASNYPFILRQKWSGDEQIAPAFEIIDFVRRAIGYPSKQAPSGRSPVLNGIKETAKKEGLEPESDLVSGALELVNSIYNNVLSRSVRADSFSDNTAHDISKSPYRLAGNNLGIYARTVVTKNNQQVNTTLWAWRSETRFLVRDTFSNQQLMTLYNVPWGAFLNAFTSDKWQTSLLLYRAALSDLQTFDYIHSINPDAYRRADQQRADKVALLEEMRSKHVDISQEKIIDEYWRIKNNPKNPDHFRISVYAEDQPNECAFFEEGSVQTGVNAQEEYWEQKKEQDLKMPEYQEIAGVIGEIAKKAL